MIAPGPIARVAARLVSGAGVTRALPEEVAVALVYNGTTQAVMMATPADLDDFARGFTVTEGIAAAEEVGEIEIVAHGPGIEARIWLPPTREAALAARRRAMVGPVGCGLCGIDSLEGALRTLPRVSGAAPLPPEEGAAALEALQAAQPLHDETRAVHAAGFWRDGRMVAVREDVGRHNALDKLAGALAAAGIDGRSGAVVLTSRVSVEMVQKAAMIGAGTVVAVSAPTAQAVRIAAAAGVTILSRAGGVLMAFGPEEG